MPLSPSRRALLHSGLPLLAAPALRAQPAPAPVRIALNSYSFNQPLRDGAITLSGVVRFCADHGIGALDATGYYFPGYPAVPEDSYLRSFKREAFRHGVSIIGTGVRNDFTAADPAARARDVQLVKNWIEAAARLGASILRIFSGQGVPPGLSRLDASTWLLAALQECLPHAERHGVILGLQNHNDFLKTAEQTILVARAVNSPWFGVILDTGSLRQSDPYAEIERLLPYAVSWQLKENVFSGGREVPTDLARVRSIIERAGYRGFLPIETLGPGDPQLKVTRFLASVRAVFG